MREYISVILCFQVCGNSYSGHRKLIQQCYALSYFFKTSPRACGLPSVLCSIPLYLSAHCTGSTNLRPGEMTTCPRSCALETQLPTLSRCPLSPGWKVYGPMRCGHPEPITLVSRPHSLVLRPQDPLPLMVPSQLLGLYGPFS